jgi:2-iminobutanoate/2-iminopropanoate deaminase
MKLRTLIATVATLLSMQSAAVFAEPQEPEFFAAPSAPNRPLPFSEAVKAGPFLYVSGMIGIKRGTTELVPGGIQTETRAAMEAIKATVENHGSSMDRVVKCTVFLADMAEWAAMNEVYVTFFQQHRPRAQRRGREWPGASCAHRDRVHRAREMNRRVLAARTIAC